MIHASRNPEISILPARRMIFDAIMLLERSGFPAARTMERAQLARRAARREPDDLARPSPTPGGRDLDQDARRAG